MNNAFKAAKERYNSIEIPQELGSVVQNAIESGGKKKNRVKVHVMRIAPVAACAVICLAVGISYLSDFGKTENIANPDTADTTAFDGGDASAARSMPKAAAGGADTEAASEFGISVVQDKAQQKAVSSNDVELYNYAVQEKFTESIKECVELEKSSDAYGEIEEIYSDGEILSYNVITYPSAASNFYNIRQSDGSDISIRDIIGDDLGFDDDCEFYFKSRDKLVVISNGEEIEVIID